MAIPKDPVEMGVDFSAARVDWTLDSYSNFIDGIRQGGHSQLSNYARSYIDRNYKQEGTVRRTGKSTKRRLAALLDLLSPSHNDVLLISDDNISWVDRMVDLFGHCLFNDYPNYASLKRGVVRVGGKHLRRVVADRNLAERVRGSDANIHFDINYHERFLSGETQDLLRYCSYTPEQQDVRYEEHNIYAVPTKEELLRYDLSRQSYKTVANMLVFIELLTNKGEKTWIVGGDTDFFSFVYTFYGAGVTPVESLDHKMRLAIIDDPHPKKKVINVEELINERYKSRTLPSDVKNRKW